MRPRALAAALLVLTGWLLGRTADAPAPRPCAEPPLADWSPPAEHVLAGLLDDEDPEVRAGALAALAELRTPDAARLLARRFDAGAARGEPEGDVALALLEIGGTRAEVRARALAAAGIAPEVRDPW